MATKGRMRKKKAQKNSKYSHMKPTHSRRTLSYWREDLLYFIHLESDRVMQVLQILQYVLHDQNSTLLSEPVGLKSSIDMW